MKYLLATAGLAVALGVGWLLLRPVAVPPATPVAETASPAAAAAHPAPVVPQKTGGDDLPMPPELANIPLKADAIASLRGAREFGDPRTPPIGRSAPPGEPTPEELADPAKYAQFEARQERKIKRAYVLEAEKYAQQLRDDIAHGKAIGIPPEKIAVVEEKIRRIDAMRAKLLADDPALLDPNSPVPVRPESMPAPGTPPPGN